MIFDVNKFNFFDIQIYKLLVILRYDYKYNNEELRQPTFRTFYIKRSIRPYLK